MKTRLLVLIGISGCSPVPEPSININDWSEQTKSTSQHIPRDTYEIVISYLDSRLNDTISTIYSHYPTTKKDVLPDYLTNVPTFYAPDNEHKKGYMNVKDISIIKATVSSNNIGYIQSMLEKQDSTKKLKAK
jgi:hypothetical protein